MKYYSEVTKRFYDNVEALEKDETAIKRKEEERAQLEKAKKAERASRAKELNEAIAEAEKAAEKARKLMADFLKDYGSYHTSIKRENKKGDTYSSLFDLFWDTLNDFI